MIYKIGYRTGGEWKYEYFSEQGISEILKSLAYNKRIERFSVTKMEKTELKGVRENGKEKE